MSTRGKWPIITYYEGGHYRPWPHWRAMRDSYEPPMPIGYGRTEQEAIDDLLGLEDEETDQMVAA